MDWKDFMESPLTGLRRLCREQGRSPRLWLPWFGALAFIIVTVVFIIKTLRQI